MIKALLVERGSSMMIFEWKRRGKEDIRKSRNKKAG